MSASPAPANTDSGSSADASASAPQKMFAPSRFVVDEETRKKYRLCAAAAVINSKGQLLVGERTSIANAWQAPQGGVDAAWEENNHQAETIVEAAARELYEEMGLVEGKHVALLKVSNDETREFENNGLRYETSGASNWLTKAGFSGQQLHWVVYRCVDGRGDQDASLIADLSGQNGEAPEFARVEWRDLNLVIKEMWPAKRGPYEALKSRLDRLNEEWAATCQICTSEFAGYWSRDNTLNQNLKDALIARGVDTDKAQHEVTTPYRQHWNPVQLDSVATTTSATTPFPAWQVITYAKDNVTPRRTLIYNWGSWEESYKGGATLFGTSANNGQSANTLYRNTFYVPQPLLDVASVMAAHVTITKTPKGDLEESRRYRDGKYFVLKRTFWSSAQLQTGGMDGVVSFEYFVSDNK